MKKKILLMGSTGKMGRAVKAAFEDSYDVIGKNSSDFDAEKFDQVQSMVEEIRPDIVVNTVAFLGIDPSEDEPEKALRLNALYPKLLAGLSREQGFVLVHFSTDAVFNDEKGDYYVESDSPSPLNMYGLTKYGGDCFIRESAEKYYICRVSILFGETGKDTQFVEKMLKRVQDGQTSLRIAGDIISSPSYARDIAGALKNIILAQKPYGTYHMANEGQASLHDLMSEICRGLDLDIDIEKGSYRDFPYRGVKNTYTPIRSEKIQPLRPWKEAVREYCGRLKESLSVVS